MIVAKVTAQVDQEYIDRAATRKVNTWVKQKLKNVLKTFSDKVLKQQKEMKESLQASQSLLERVLSKLFHQHRMPASWQLTPIFAAQRLISPKVRMLWLTQFRHASTPHHPVHPTVQALAALQMLTLRWGRQKLREPRPTKNSTTISASRRPAWITLSILAMYPMGKPADVTEWLDQRLK